jgi:hypothetical protein
MNNAGSELQHENKFKMKEDKTPFDVKDETKVNKKLEVNESVL